VEAAQRERVVDNQVCDLGAERLSSIFVATWFQTTHTGPAPQNLPAAV
jgi:hypothetical protein